MNKYVLLLSSLLLLYGCATTKTVWEKPGANEAEFSKTRYKCLKDSQQRVSSSSIDEFGGSSSSEVVTNEKLFNACMYAEGYKLVKKKK